MKRVWNILFALVLTLAIFPVAFAAEKEQVDAVLPERIVVQQGWISNEVGLCSVEDADWDAEWTCFRDQLTGDAATLYDGFLSETFFVRTVVSRGQECAVWGTKDLVEEIEISGDYQDELDERVAEMKVAIDAACHAFVLDHPECFWLRSGYHYSYKASIRGNKMTMTWKISFMAYPATDSEEEVDALQDQVDAVVLELLEATENMSTLGKLKYMDNWLAEHNHYNQAAARDGSWISRDETPWSAVGGLLDAYSPVCEGYAKAFQLFCHEIGVPCLQISGTADDEDHMWNYVQYEGQWYFCDTTWDDPLYAGDGGGMDRDESTGTYFMLGRQDSHVPEMDFALPELAESALSQDCAGGHSYSAVVTDPTCMEGGYTTYTCEVCGDSYVDDVTEPIDHVYGEFEDDAAECIYGCGNALHQTGKANWKLENGVVTGHEYGTGMMLIALYNESGRMLSMQFCSTTFWMTVGEQELWRFDAPVFDAAVLTQATRVVRYNLGTSYVPIQGARTVANFDTLAYAVRREEKDRDEEVWLFYIDGEAKKLAVAESVEIERGCVYNLTLDEAGEVVVSATERADTDRMPRYTVLSREGTVLTCAARDREEQTFELDEACKIYDEDDGKAITLERGDRMVAIDLDGDSDIDLIYVDEHER